MVFVAISTSTVHAMNYTTPMFADAQRYSDSNSYKNSTYNFSIQPPLNWMMVSLPPEISNGTIVTFSNGEKSELATFGIQHSVIGQNITRSSMNHSDNDILTTVARGINSNSSDSSTVITNGIVDRYTDGIRIVVSYTTHYISDDSTILGESVYYFLDNGNKYTLDMASNPNSIQKNAQLFADSAETFLVGQASTVPEFPIAPVALVAAMIFIIVASRFGLLIQHSTYTT
jgi:hypothetical protein